MAAEPTKASCRCGATEFELTGAPLLTMACHCTGCQKMTGSAYSLSTLFAEDHLRVTKGETVAGGLKGEIDHRCCPACHSWVFTHVGSGFVNVRSTMIDDAAVSAPFLESYTCEKLPFAETGAKHSFEKFPGPEDYGDLMAEFAALNK